MKDIVDELIPVMTCTLDELYEKYDDRVWSDENRPLEYYPEVSYSFFFRYIKLLHLRHHFREFEVEIVSRPSEGGAQVRFEDKKSAAAAAVAKWQVLVWPRSSGWTGSSSSTVKV